MGKRNLMGASENPVMQAYRETSQEDRGFFREIVKVSNNARDFGKLHRAYKKNPDAFKEVLETARHNSNYTDVEHLKSHIYGECYGSDPN
ncbi:MAG: hypothetical protein KC506_00940, partial [Nanoarchaeota archaeon]|nr:hypothetical protein [Nanoarchaeota archaeon]